MIPILQKKREKYIKFQKRTNFYPPRSTNDLNYICHSELVSESNDLKKSAGLPRRLENTLVDTHPQSSPLGAEEQFRKYRCGFTLAEVLITLVIIGVIAAITVPTLIIKHQKEETVTRLKKAYSTLVQTTQRAIADNGPIETWDRYTDLTEENMKKFNSKYLIPYLAVQKTQTTSSEGNWSPVYYYLNSNEAQEYPDSFIRFYLSDGVSITNYFNSSERIYIFIDINGDKKPNRYGRDIFVYIFYLDMGKFLPKGYYAPRSDLVGNMIYMCNKNQIGEACSALIMKDSWQIKDDYPW